MEGLVRGFISYDFTPILLNKWKSFVGFDRWDRMCQIKNSGGRGVKNLDMFIFVLNAR